MSSERIATTEGKKSLKNPSNPIIKSSNRKSYKSQKSNSIISKLPEKMNNTPENFMRAKKGEYRLNSTLGLINVGTTNTYEIAMQLHREFSNPVDLCFNALIFSDASAADLSFISKPNIKSGLTNWKVKMTLPPGLPITVSIST